MKESVRDRRDAQEDEAREAVPPELLARHRRINFWISPKESAPTVHNASDTREASVVFELRKVKT